MIYLDELEERARAQVADTDKTWIQPEDVLELIAEVKRLRAFAEAAVLNDEALDASEVKFYVPAGVFEAGLATGISSRLPDGRALFCGVVVEIAEEVDHEH